MCWSKPAVLVYGKNDCTQCDMTVKVLDKEGLDFTYINIEEDVDAFEYVTKTLGYRQAPAVVALYPDGSETHWSGFRPEKIKGYVATARKWRE